jgi:hypothetical protein
MDLHESSSGNILYIFDFVVTDTGTGLLSVNSAELQLVGTSNAVYPSVNGLAMDIFLPAVLNPRQHVSGQTAFLVPRSDKPSKLQFLSLSIQATDDTLPAPSANVTYISAFDSKVTDSAANNVAVSYLLPQNFTTTSSQGYYYSGQVIALKLTLGYSIGYSGNDTFHVTSINNSAGFRVLGISPPLPIGVGSSGTDVMLYLLAPDSYFDGQVAIVIEVN